VKGILRDRKARQHRCKLGRKKKKPTTQPATGQVCHPSKPLTQTVGSGCNFSLIDFLWLGWVVFKLNQLGSLPY